MLIQLLPLFLRSVEVTQIQEAIEPALLDFLDAQKDAEDQIYVDTATWALEYWERLYGIDTLTDQAIEDRRSKIKSRIRGNGTTTAALIKNIAESFTNGAVAVVEDYGNYTVSIQFVGRLGPPPNIADIKKSINRVIPAHLNAEYIFVYRIWNELGGMTWTEAGQYTWNELKSKEGVV